MTIVTTKVELEAALKRGDSHIAIRGELAEKVQQKMKHKKATRIAAGVLAGGALVSAPFTGGASLPGVAVGATIALSGEVLVAIALLYVGSMGVIALLKNYEVITVKSPVGGEVELRKKS